jgi:hypothetical protein
MFAEKANYVASGLLWFTVVLFGLSTIILLSWMVFTMCFKTDFSAFFCLSMSIVGFCGHAGWLVTLSIMYPRFSHAYELAKDNLNALDGW